MWFETLAFKQHIEFSEGRPMTEKHEPSILIGFSILSFFPQHLQTKHITEWKKCEEERKEMECIDGRSSSLMQLLNSKPCH